MLIRARLENFRAGARWWLVSLPARVATLTVAFLAVVGAVIFVVAHYLLGGPPTGQHDHAVGRVIQSGGGA
jgi:hypothetical protein